LVGVEHADDDLLDIGTHDGGHAGTGPSGVVAGLEGDIHRRTGRAGPGCRQRNDLGVRKSRVLMSAFTDDVTE
jgi:hypothetical protein